MTELLQVLYRPNHVMIWFSWKANEQVKKMIKYQPANVFQLPFEQVWMSHQSAGQVGEYAISLIGVSTALFVA